MTTEDPPADRPVRVLLHTEIFATKTYNQAQIEIPRAQWNAMSPQQRRAYLDRALEEHETDLVGSGWDLLGEDAGEAV